MTGVCFLGVDPGLDGGLALVSQRDGVLLEVMPTIGSELDFHLLAKILKDWAPDIRKAYLEHVHAMPKQGVASMFKFGKVFGGVQGVLATLGIPFELVRPQAWQKVMHQGTPASANTKDRSRLAFARLFPGVNALASDRSRVPHDGMVEAALMAEYGRRMTVGSG